MKCITCSVYRLHIAHMALNSQSTYSAPMSLRGIWQSCCAHHALSYDFHILYSIYCRFVSFFSSTLFPSLSLALALVRNILFDQKQPVSIGCLFVDSTYIFHRFFPSLFSGCFSYRVQGPDFSNQNKKRDSSSLSKHKTWNKINLHIWHSILQNIFICFVHIRYSFSILKIIRTQLCGSITAIATSTATACRFCWNFRFCVPSEIQRYKISHLWH